MKKTIHNAFTLIVMLALIVSSCLWTGCSTTGKTSLLGSVKQVIVGDDYEAAGKAVGEAGYTAYVILKGNPKYEKYTKKCEELYAALDDAESETVKLGTVNQVALEVMQAALTAKYGYAKASLITTGVRIGGAVADRIIAKRVDAVAADQFLKGFKQGLDLAIAKTPADAFAEPYKPKAFDCKDGNCTVIVGSRAVRHQRNVAQQLIDEGYADKDAKPKADGNPTAYQNLKDLIERCDTLKKLNVAETNCYIHHFTVKDGKLAEIEFRVLDDGKEVAIDCVSCCALSELDDIAE